MCIEYGAKAGQLAGILVRDEEKAVHDLIANEPRFRFVNSDDKGRRYVTSAHCFMTNDPRWIAALHLLGFETIGSRTVRGIETFMKLNG